MGATNVSKAFLHWRPHLTHREMCALLYMANTSLDADTPPVYFGGWEAVAGALALGGKPATVKRTTLQVLAELAQAGAITSSGSAHSGVRAEYALNLEPGHRYQPVTRGRGVKWEAVKRVPTRHTHPIEATPLEGVQDTHPPVSTTHTHKGVHHAPERVPTRHTPRGTQEPRGGRTEEALPITGLPAPVTKSDPGKPDARSQTPEHRATDDAYAKTGKAFNFLATRQIAKWAIHERGKSEAQVSRAIVSTYQAGKPITKQTIGQFLDGFTTGSPQAAGQPHIPPAYWMHNS